MSSFKDCPMKNPQSLPFLSFSIFLFPLIFAFFPILSTAQTYPKAGERQTNPTHPLPNNILARTALDLRLWPFYHGVASGDPLSDRVIIWTRVTPNYTAGPATVSWEMATDTGLTNIVQMGQASTDSSKDWTVKVDVTGLQPNNWYYYRFKYNDRKSLTGRTRTTPVGDVDSLRFAVVSCSDYVDGYFHAYRKIAERNDVDAVIHLGDYIYENGSAGDIGRPHEPLKRTTELDDYRQRYSQYRLDPDLRCIHQMYPFINVWDDHESANNSWKGGAEAHDFPADGYWEHRKRMAVQANEEWIPMRKPDPADTVRIYRTLEWGDLMDLIMIDTRLIARDSQVTGADLNDPSRNMLGPVQLGWLSNEMESSAAQWKIIGQQVMMAPLNIPLLQDYTNDSWDGYPAERQRFYDTVLTKNISDVVVLTGDIHTSWANNLESGGNPVGVEFVVTSVTTMNSPIGLPIALIQITNPHIKYANLNDHGFYLLNVTKTRTQTDFYYVGDITDAGDNSLRHEASWYTATGSRVLSQANGAMQPRAELVGIVQPSKNPPNPVGLDEGEDPLLTVVGAYPNPFWDYFLVKTWLFEPMEIHLNLFDSQGKKVIESTKGMQENGLHYYEMDCENLASGVYLLEVLSGGQRYTRLVQKW